MLLRRLIVLSSVIVLGSLVYGDTSSEKARQPEPAQSPTTKPPKARWLESLQEEGLRLQESDDALQLFTPKKPQSAEEKARVDALAWYLTGRLRHERRNFRGALEAYERAAELDPKSPAIYRAMVAVAIELKENERAIQYALKALELTPNDSMLLRMVGTYLAGRPGRLSQAIDLLERAANSKTVKKRSSFYVTLMRDLAGFYMLAQQYDKAADRFETVLDARLHPEKYNLDAQTRARLARDKNTSFQRIGQVFAAAKRYQKAIAAFNQAVRQRKGNAGPISYDLAYAYLMIKEPEKALNHLQTYFNMQLQSKGRAAYQLLTEILRKLDREDELIPRLDEMAQKDSRNSTLQYFLAEQYVHAGRLKDAEKLYTKTLADSKNPLGHIGLAAVYRKQNRPEELLDSLAIVLNDEESAREYAAAIDRELLAISKDPKIIDGLFATGKRRMASQDQPLEFAPAYLLARLAAQIKRTPAVVEFYRYALKQQNSVQRLAVLYEQLGMYLLDQDKYAESAGVFREAYQNASLAPLRSYFAVRLAQALEMDGKTDDAVTVLTETRKEKDTPQLHLQQGWVYYHSRRWDEAIRTFTEVIEKYASHDDETIRDIVRRCKYSLSNCYVEQGNIEKGEQVLEQILETDPDDPSVNNDLGYLWADQGKNLERAEKMIRKALEAEPENGAYLDSMGWVLFKRGKYADALKYLKKAAASTESTGGDAVIWEHVGDCHERLKQFSEAREAWNNTLKFARKSAHPDQKIIERVEAKLKKIESQKEDTQTDVGAQSAAPPDSD